MRVLIGFLSLITLCVCMYFGYLFGTEIMKDVTYKESAIRNEKVIYMRK